MTPAQGRSAPSSKTACSQCTCQRSRRPNPSKSRSTSPERARRSAGRLRPGLAPGPKAKPQQKFEMQMKPQLFEGKNLTDVNRMTQFAFQAPTARQVTL